MIKPWLWRRRTATNVSILGKPGSPSSSASSRPVTLGPPSSKRSSSSRRRSSRSCSSSSVETRATHTSRHPAMGPGPPGPPARRSPRVIASGAVRKVDATPVDSCCPLSSSTTSPTSTLRRPRRPRPRPRPRGRQEILPMGPRALRGQGHRARRSENGAARAAPFSLRLPPHGGRDQSGIGQAGGDRAVGPASAHRPDSTRSSPRSRDERHACLSVLPAGRAGPAGTMRRRCSRGRRSTPSHSAPLPRH